MPDPQNFPVRCLSPMPAPGESLSPALWAGFQPPTPFQKVMDISPPKKRSYNDFMMSLPRGSVSFKLCMNYKINNKNCTILDMLKVYFQHE